MGSTMTDEQLRKKALSAFREQLGPVEVIRFLSMVRQQPRDYVRWRDEHFKALQPDMLIEQLKQIP